MMRFRITVGNLLIMGAMSVVVSGVAPPVAAQPVPGFGGPGFADPMAGELGGRSPRGDGLADFLGLTEEQRDEWQALHGDHRADVQPMLEEIRSLQEELDGALGGASPDATMVGELMLTIRALRAEIQSSYELLEDRLAAVLTPEQAVRWEAFEAAMALLRGGRRGFFGNGPAGGPGGSSGRPRGPRGGLI